MKKEKCTGKIENLMEPGDGNENELTKTKVEYDGEENEETGEQQLRNEKIRSQLLILIPPMTVYVTSTQVPAETTLMEPRK